MDETQSQAEQPGEEVQAAAAAGINLGDFTRTQGLMKSLRLTLHEQTVVSVEELASGLSDAGRKFKMGELEQANQDVARLYSAFGQKTGQWESQARGLEQQMKTQAAKNPKSISIDKMNRMKSEQIAVRTRIRTAEVQFRRLHQGLDQAFTNLQRQSALTTENPVDCPSDFLARFKAAAVADRPRIVEEFYAIEAVLSVSVTRGTTSRYDIKFDLPPPLNRLYFFTQASRVFRLSQLSQIVVLYDVETGQQNEIKLVEFVRQVQAGAWLLTSRS